MFKLHDFRLGNSLLLGLIGLLSGSVFFLSNGAHGDSFGTDCPPNWQNTSGFCFGDEILVDTHGTNCATSPSGLCCNYEVYKVECSLDQLLMGYAYQLNGAGQSGKTCTPMGCR